MSNQDEHRSPLARGGAVFDRLAIRIAQFVRSSTVVRRDFGGGGIIVIGPTHQWAPLTDEGRVEQVKLRRAYADWFDRFARYIKELPSGTRKNVEQADSFIRAWIEHEVSFATVPDPDRAVNQREIGAKLGTLREAVRLLERAGV